MSDPSDTVQAIVAAGRQVQVGARRYGAGEPLLMPRGMATALAGAGFVVGVQDGQGSPVTYSFSLTNGGATAVLS